MTGFGKAEVKSKSGTFSIEMTSVNNRFLETTIRLPRPFTSFEPLIRETINSRVERGKITVFVNFEESLSSDIKQAINSKTARQVHKQLVVLKKELKLSGEITIQDIISHPEVTKSDFNKIDEKEIGKSLVAGVEKALTKLVKMRVSEGKTLGVDMKKRSSVLSKEIKKIEALAKKSIGQFRARLNDRINELLDEPVGDKNRLEEEIAIIADRTDITEECIRFDSHLKQFDATINKGKGAIGKKLNFILQELNREANTIASKCSDINISANSIVLKEEIEKLREQVQNIE